ncbi:Respiratory nitrate reductase 1 beta chain [Raoultella ornithinolytica]|nr:Respiratory nitrate reductase 1 beta chain [Raoultella ornithinolytica]
MRAQKSPVYKMAMDWKLALPLHPEYRTLPMVWYVPPLSPIQSAADAGELGSNGIPAGCRKPCVSRSSIWPTC